MKYVILIHANPNPWGHPTGHFTDEGRRLDDTQRAAMDRKFDELMEAMSASGELIVGEALADPASSTIYRWDGQHPRGHRRTVRRDQGAPRRVLPRRRRVARAGRGDRCGVRPSGRRHRAATCDVARRPRRVSEPSIDVVWRACAPRVLGALIRRYGHVDAAEDALQEALVAAARQWPAEGMPDDPKAWLIRVASRKLVDRLRADDARARREERVALRGDDERLCDGRARGRVRRLRRHPRGDAAVLPSVAEPAVAGGAHAARRGRSHDGADRSVVPGP